MSTGSSGFKEIHPGANPNSLISERGCSHPAWAGEVSALHPDPRCASWVEEATGAKAATAEHRKQTKNSSTANRAGEHLKCSSLEIWRRKSEAAV